MSTRQVTLALSLYQPWATLVAIGAKRHETRSWQTAWRGRLAIHAGLKFGAEEGLLMQEEPFRTALHRAGIHIPGQLPRGAILATCRLVDCVRTEHISGRLSEQELAFGDYTPGRYAWQLDDIQLLPTPIKTRGRQMLWDVTDVLYQ